MGWVQTAWAQANKQQSFSLNIGPDLLVPESELRNTHRTGFGGSVKAEYTFGKHLSATFNTGFASLPGARYFDSTVMKTARYKNMTAIPLKLGIRYYVGSFYVAGEGGMVLLGQFTSDNNGVGSIGLGDKINIGRHNKLDISLRYEYWLRPQKDYRVIGVRIGYEIMW
jgi:hypothetical protein